MKNETKNNLHIINNIYEEEEIKQIVAEVKEDFEKRRLERASLELSWQQNINFLMGNQFSSMSPLGELEDYGKQYFWQEREAFNHIAPLIETRISKLSRVRPSMTVVPTSDEDKDIYSAKLAKSIIKSMQHRVNINNILSEGTKWSEICGTVFYKVVWSSSSGMVLAETENGKKIRFGDVDIVVCPPYEIYPESSSCANIDDCKSLIHARAYHIDEIKNIWGVDVSGEDIDVFSLEAVSTMGGLGYNSTATKAGKTTKHNQSIVIEKYEMPTSEYPNGRLIIVAGDKLLHIDDLPFINKADAKRGFPFIRQVALEQPASFWGKSIIERCIPIQRAYNAVKNRKHEFLNRLSMGVIAVEDGSIDMENLEEEGLCPGKVLVYRQGSNPPHMMNAGDVPADFVQEENALLNEFILISGTSDLSRGSRMLGNSNTSGRALQLLIEQDDSRLASTCDQIRFAVLEMAKQAIRLYKQFANVSRLAKIVSGTGEIETFYFSASDLSSDDVIFETESEISETLAQKRNMVFELLNAGLLHDESGKLSNRMRAKVLELLGWGVWENAQDTSTLHLRRADKENLACINGEKIIVEDFDDHELHINQHIAYMLSGEFEKEIKENSTKKQKLAEHIREHKNVQEMLAQVLSTKANMSLEK